MSEAKLAVVSGGDTDVAEHAEIRQKVKDLRTQVEESYWDLSHAMYEVYQGSYYIAWGFASWKEYIEGELDFQLRKAQYLVSIQDWFGRMKPNVQKWVRELGWTKAKELVGIVTNENAAEWKKKLEGKSVRELIETIKEGSEEGLDEDVPTTSTADDGEKSSKRSFSLFPAQLENVDRAVERAKEMANSDKEGHAIDLICTDFLATNSGVGTIQEYLSKVEKHTGVRLVGYSESDDAIVFGGDLLDELAEDEES